MQNDNQRADRLFQVLKIYGDRRVLEELLEKDFGTTGSPEKSRLERILHVFSPPSYCF